MNPPNTNQDGIKAFLQEVKDTVTATQAGYPTWVLVPRPKNNDCLAKLEYTFTDVKAQILDLAVKNYIRGPFPDQDERGEFWEFGKTIEGNEIYIKLKLANFGNLKKVRIVSFHVAELPIHYPFKD